MTLRLLLVTQRLLGLFSPPEDFGAISFAIWRKVEFFAAGHD